MRLAFVAALLLVTTAALADPPLEACINKGNGGMRLVAADVACHANETRVLWDITGPIGPQGPAGPAGPQGPAGIDGTSAPSGPPYVWVCTPANYFSGSSTFASVFIFNGSASTANVAMHLLNKDGVNLTGAVVPGASPVNPGDPAPTYPGQTGATTVPVLAFNTLVVNWFAAQGDPAAGGNVPATLRVIADQPIAVGTNIQFSGFHPVPCNLLPR
jgi:hypothetical protein